MTHAEFYLEVHIIQFYRLLFFAQELIARGIVTDADDIYDGPLSYDIVPEYIQSIVYNDDS